MRLPLRVIFRVKVQTFKPTEIVSWDSGCSISVQKALKNFMRNDCVDIYVSAHAHYSFAFSHIQN